VTGALAVEDFDPEKDDDPVTYSFATLRAMQFESTKQWSVVYDVRNGRVFFERARGGKRGYFDLQSIDFGADARSLVLADIDLDQGGDVSGQFVEYSRDIDRAIITSFLRSLVRFVARTDEPAAMDRYMMERYGFAFEQYVERALDVTELIRTGDR
jgi:hypothetical protein